MRSPAAPASGDDPRGRESASRSGAGHDRHVRLQPSPLHLRSAIALAALALLTACGNEPDLPPLPPLPPVQLNSAQSEALQRMNTAGTTAFAGWTWRYEFGAGCRIRVIKRYEGRPVPVIEHTLIDHYAEIVPYPGVGYGVKAYPRAKPGSADLFEAGTEPLAAEFASNVERLMTACSGSTTPNR
jgi:hypothetical protein